MFATAYNRTGGPLTIDREGRSIGGRTWGTVETTDDVAAGHLEAGRLRLIDVKPRSGQHPAAREALERTKLVTSRATKAGKLDKDELAELAEQAGIATVSPSGDTLHKPELAARVAQHLEVDLPSSTASSSSTSEPTTSTEES